MPKTTYEHLLVERRDDGVAVLTINRPNKLNAMNTQTRHELGAALTELGPDPAVGAVILTGAGDRAFSSGLDLSEAQQLAADEITPWQDAWKEAQTALFDLDKPIIAAIHGYAVGAGLQLAASCDVRICADDSRFGLAEINDGIPCTVGTYVMWDLVGRGRAAHFVLTGEMVDAQTAFAWGIVTKVVPRAQLMDAAIELARSLAAKPKVGMRGTKAMLRRLYEAGYLEARELAKDRLTEAFTSGDPKRAMGDFLAHRREGRST